MPLLPGFDLAFDQIVERLQQTGNGKRGGGLLAAAETQRQNTTAWQCANQRHIPGARGLVTPAERTIAVEVLPPVTLADITDAGRPKGILLCFIRYGEREPERTLLRREHAPAAKLRDLSEIVIA